KLPSGDLSVRHGRWQRALPRRGPRAVDSAFTRRAERRTGSPGFLIEYVSLWKTLEGVRMLRLLIGATLALTLVGGFGWAAEKGRGNKSRAAKGTIKKVDADKGILTVAVKSKKTEATEKEFKISDDTQVVIFSGKSKTELTGKAGLKNDRFQEGAA